MLSRARSAEQEAKDVVNALKTHGMIAKDSIVPLGNTHVRKVCCESGWRPLSMAGR